METADYDIELFNFPQTDEDIVTAEYPTEHDMLQSVMKILQ